MEANHDKIMERLARELGALTVNNHILEIELEETRSKTDTDAIRMDALVKRVVEQDDIIRELRDFSNNLRKKAKKEDGKDPA